MKWTNYHNHCHYCDGKETIETHVQAAIEQGVSALGLTCHCPVPFANVWSMKLKDLQKYLDELDLLKVKYDSSIQLFKSLEVDYIPGIMGPYNPMVLSSNLDYSIGSLHFVGLFDDGYPCVIDGPHNSFTEGLDKIFGNDVKRMIGQYYENTRQMVREECPDIIGHLDKIKMQNQNLWDENDDWYRKEVLQTLEEIAGSKAIIEVNTRGIYKKVTEDTYPGSWVLDEIKNLGIPICINSDAHHPKELLGGFSETAPLLIQKGFKHVMVFDGIEWGQHEFSEKGIFI
jgi:histidinol-phosphatase (PHP family)